MTTFDLPLDEHGHASTGSDSCSSREADFRGLVEPLGRRLVQRSTLYERVVASAVA